MMNSTIFGNNIKSHFNSLPQDMPKAICKAAVYGFAFTTVFSGNPALGLTAAAFSALATTINILVTPIFANNNYITIKNCFMRNALTSIVTLGAISLISPAASINVATSFVAKCIFNALHSNEYGVNVSKADIFVMM